MSTRPVPVSFRRADLDWLRVSAFGLLIFYHAGMAWSGWNWHLTSVESIGWLREDMRFLNSWRMPLIFVVSGAAIILALSTRSRQLRGRPGGAPVAATRLWHDRSGAAARLCRASLPQTVRGSFLDFLLQAFTGAYPAGKLRTHHLWFLAYVLVLTFVLLPCFLWLRSAQGRAMHAKAGSMAARAGLQWLMPLPLAAAMLWLTPISGDVNGYDGYGLVGPWYGLSYYGVLLLYGAFLFGSPALLAALNRQRYLSLGIEIGAYAFFYFVYVDGAVRPVIPKGGLAKYALVAAVNTMAWLFAIIGFANRYLMRRPAFLTEATEAVYPFYLLHQTVTVIAVYWLLRVGASPLVGFAVAVIATFVGTSVIYFCFVRPLWFVRPFFGLKAATLAGRGGPTEFKRTGPRLSVSP